MPKNTLEKVVKSKIEPLLEQTMKQFLGKALDNIERDISDELEASRLIGFKVKTDLPFKEAKKEFKKEFLKKNIQTHQGNISEVADSIGLNRRSIHRNIKNLGIDMKELRKNLYKANYFRREAVDSIIKNSMDHYKRGFDENKLEEFYNYLPELSEDIVDILFKGGMGWEEAEKEFERFYLEAALKRNKGNVSKTAKEIGLRKATLFRKLKELKI